MFLFCWGDQKRENVPLTMTSNFSIGGNIRAFGLIQARAHKLSANYLITVSTLVHP